MSLFELATTARKDHVSPSFWDTWRLPALCIFLLIVLGYTTFLGSIAPAPDTNNTVFVRFCLLGCIPYVLACVLILSTKASVGRKRWIEIAIIVLGALLMRVQLLHISPNLSHDSWRYLWDARVTLHGFSPYVYAPGNSQLLQFRDVIYDNSRFRNVPTIYPPGAQAFYLISYLLAQGNLTFLKGIFTVCELISCLSLAYLLKQRGQDPARCIIYAWCPLPILEFAIQGHLDALTVMFMLLTVLVAQSPRRGARVLTGFLLALATLTKLYPILLFAVVWRGRRDWALLLTCALTIVLAYIPYLILGHGEIFGFFGAYASEQSSANAGSVTMLMHSLSVQFGWPILVTYIVDLLLVGSSTLLVWFWRRTERISVIAAILLLLGTILLVSTHIFPWYTIALLPSVALLIEKPWSRSTGWSSQALVAIGVWYFVCLSMYSYFDNPWDTYYLLVYDVLFALLALALIVMFVQRKNKSRAQRPIHENPGVKIGNM